MVRDMDAIAERQMSNLNNIEVGYLTVGQGPPPTLEPPSGTTEDWHLIVFPISAGIKSLVQDRKITGQTKAIDDEHELNYYFTYFEESADHQSWIVHGGIKLEEEPSHLDVGYFMAKKNLPKKRSIER